MAEYGARGTVRLAILYGPARLAGAHRMVALVARDTEGLARLCSLFARHLAEDIAHHFDFEERELFPLLETVLSRA